MTDPAQAGTRTADRTAFNAASCQEFTAEVTAIREVARIDGRQVWQIALSQTLFDPARFNTGVLVATARSGKVLEIAVTAVEVDNNRQAWHTAYKPLQEGTVVRGLVHG